MSETLEAVRRLVATGDVRISEHGYDELSEDNISVRDVLSGIKNAVLVEDYRRFGRFARDAGSKVLRASAARGAPVGVIVRLSFRRLTLV